MSFKSQAPEKHPDAPKKETDVLCKSCSFLASYRAGERPEPLEVGSWLAGAGLLHLWIVWTQL